jgi:hypothetical protein
MIATALLTIICTCGPVSDSTGGPYEPADRMEPPTTTLAVLPSWPTGLYGLPFAPFGLSDCEEMMFYAKQFGLPAAFQPLGWRESNCRNEDGIHTSCCYGYWQLHAMHFVNHPEVYGRICNAWSYQDVNSDNPLDKQRQACSAKQLYDAAGMSPW